MNYSLIEREQDKIAKYFESRDLMSVIRNTVAKGATEAEFVMFSEVCKSSGLDPFKKEIWFMKIQGQTQIFTGINGYLKIANLHPAFDGMSDELIYEDGKLVGAKCSVYRKDRAYPVVAIAYIDEYRKSSPTWSKMPKVMIKKCAKSVALREAFAQQLGGTYTEEEFGIDEEENKTKTAKVVEIIHGELVIDSNDDTDTEDKQDEQLTLEQKIEKIENLMDEKGFDDERKARAYNYFKVTDLRELTEEKADLFLMQIGRA